MPITDDDLFPPDNDFDSDETSAPWSIDDLERSADLGSLRSAWAAGADGDY